MIPNEGVITLTLLLWVNLGVVISALQHPPKVHCKTVTLLLWVNLGVAIPAPQHPPKCNAKPRKKSRRMLQWGQC